MDVEAITRAAWEELLSGEALIRLRRGELDEPLERLFHREGVIEMFDESPFHGPYVGHAGFRKWAEEAMEALEDGAHWDLDEVEVFGGLTVASGHVRGRWRSSGIELDLPFHTANRFRDGRVVYTKGFLEKEDARAFARAGGC